MAYSYLYAVFPVDVLSEMLGRIDTPVLTTRATEREHETGESTLQITGDMGKAAGVYWRNWIKADAANGESQFLEILFAFKREIEAGEDVENRGAAFTQRLKDWRKHNPAKQKPDNPAERQK